MVINLTTSFLLMSRGTSLPFKKSIKKVPLCLNFIDKLVRENCLAFSLEISDPERAKPKRND